MELLYGYLETNRYIGEGTPIFTDLDSGSVHLNSINLTETNHYRFDIDAGLVFRTNDIIGTALSLIGVNNRYKLNSTINSLKSTRLYTYDPVP